jgi:serine-type D-Ala-D-Ala carboxypeptidase (penicillin-binding protein 5/6)
LARVWTKEPRFNTIARMIKKLTIVLLVLAFAVAGQAPPVAWAQDVNVEKLHIDAPAAYLLDLDTGRVLYEKQARAERPIASTTKILTSLLVLERADLDELVNVSPRAPRVAGGKIGLKAGEQRSVKELMSAMMLSSANDAAVALAEHVGGSESGFNELMNERALALGAGSSRFANAHGLDGGTGHYSTAADIALITQAALEDPYFRRLVGTRRYSWFDSASAGLRRLTNSNLLLQDYPLATGVKTGFTSQSGYCLVATAEHEGRSVLAVVLGSPSREASFADARALLDWGLKSFAVKPVVKKNHRYAVIKSEGKTVSLVADRTIVDLIYIGPDDTPVLRPTVRTGVKLPIGRGDELGAVTVVQMGREIGSARLVAGRSVFSPRVGRNLSAYWDRVVKKLRNLF